MSNFGKLVALKCFSDNCCGFDPVVASTVEQAAREERRPYLNPLDPSVLSASTLLKRELSIDGYVGFLPTGTVANAVALATLINPGESILTADCSHIVRNEGGAIERLVGAPIRTIQTGVEGKLTAELIKNYFRENAGAGYPHQLLPRVISIANPTERGFVYTLNELQDISEFAVLEGLKIHIDGARLWNAAADQNSRLGEMLREVRYSALCLGARKAIGGEGTAIILPSSNGAIERRAVSTIKAFGALSDLSWRIAASFKALLIGDRGITNGAAANWNAQELSRRLRDIGVEITAVATNCVHCNLPSSIVTSLNDKGYFFYSHFSEVLGARFTTSWDTESSTIQSLIDAVKDAARKREKDEDLTLP